MSRSMVFFLIAIAPVMAISLAVLAAATIPANWLGWFLLLMALAYVAGIPLYLWKQKGKPPARNEERGDRSFWLVQPGFILAIFGAPLEYLFLPEILPREAWMQAAGLLLVGISVIVQGWARQAIRGQFSGHVQIQQGHRLVQSGPYRYIRHPAYLGYLLLALGVAAGYSSLVACIVILVFLLPGLVYRMRVEEKLLVEAFGDAYLQYTNQTKRLIPGIF